ncbi:hypothetical protein BGZ65_011334, partial [Modicella reniformis]
KLKSEKDRASLERERKEREKAVEAKRILEARVEGSMGRKTSESSGHGSQQQQQQQQAEKKPGWKIMFKRHQ